MAEFSDNWYVLKNRLCLFAPLREGFTFEIDKSASGGAGFNNITPDVINSRFNTNWDSNRLTEASTPLDYKDKEVSALTFGEGADKPASEYPRSFRLNTAANVELNRILYTGNRSATINFWMFCIGGTQWMGSNLDTPGSNFGISGSMLNGMTIGADFVSMALGTYTNTEGGQYANFCNRMYGKTLQELLVSGTVSGTSYSTVTGKWMMITHILDFNTDPAEGIAITTNIRYLDQDDNLVHLKLKRTNMYNGLWGGSAIFNDNWMIGIPGDGIDQNSSDNQIAIRNLMVYESQLDDDQQLRIFNNDIDPYQADAESTFDFDQHDRNYWGSYGIFATRSNIRIDKTMFGTGSLSASASGGLQQVVASTGLMPFKNYRRENIAIRDNSLLNFVGERKLVSSEFGETQDFYSTRWDDFAIDKLGSFDSSKSVELPSANVVGGQNYDAIDRPSVIAWRNSQITGFRAFDNYRIWLSEGATISGFADAIMVSDMTHPEDMPSGVYVAKLTYDVAANSGGRMKGYPEHIGILKYPRELGFVGYGNNFVYTPEGGPSIESSNQIFWKKLNRYQEIEWDGQRVVDPDDPLSLATPSNEAENWNPIYWQYVVYEVQSSSNLGDRTEVNSGNYQGRIVMHLFGSTAQNGSVVPFNIATYEKSFTRSFVTGSTTERDYGGWEFVGFKRDSLQRGQEFANRIYLPRITVPHVKIPLLKPTITLDAGSLFDRTISSITAENTGAAIGSTEHAERAQFIASDIVYLEQNCNNVKAVSMINPVDATSPAGARLYWESSSFDGNLFTPRYFQPTEDGWYEFNWLISWRVFDNNYKTWLILYSKDGGGSWVESANNWVTCGDYVNSGSKGGAPSTASMNWLVRLSKSTKYMIKMSITNLKSAVWDDGKHDHVISTMNYGKSTLMIRRSAPGGASFNNILQGFNITYDNSGNGETPARYNKYVTTDAEGQWVNLRNVEGLYSRNKKDIANGGTLVTDANVANGNDQVTDLWTTPTPYQGDNDDEDGINRYRPY